MPSTQGVRSQRVAVSPARSMGGLALALGALGAMLLLLLAVPRSARRKTTRSDPPETGPPDIGRPDTGPPVLTRELYVAGHSRPHPELCPSLGARLQLLVLVASAPSHLRARDGIRFTWGHYAARSDVALAFVLGASPSVLEPALEAEDELYGDLVVGNFVDSYSNLTLKTLSMLEWADTYCPRAPSLLKTDDDMFINVPRLLAIANAPRRRNATSTIWGKVLRNELPPRKVQHKYYLSPLQYPEQVLPDYVMGGAYLVSGDSIRPLLRAAGAELYVQLEDVFVTGILAKKLNITVQHVPAFLYSKKPSTCALQRGVAIHMVRYRDQLDLWRKLLNGKTKCAS